MTDHIKNECDECHREPTHYLCEKHYDEKMAEAHEQGFSLGVEETRKLLHEKI